MAPQRKKLKADSKTPQTPKPQSGAEKSPKPKPKKKTSNRPKKYRQYSESEKAAVLAILDSNKGSYTKTSEQTGVPFMTVWEWANGRIKTHKETTKLRFEKGMALADITEEMARLLAEVLPDKFDEADLRDSATAYGILVDKMNALRAANKDKDGEDEAEVEQTDDHLIVKLRRLRKTRARVDGDSNPGVAEETNPQGTAGDPDVGAVREQAPGDGVPQ